MSGHGTKIARQEERLIAALLLSPTIKEASAQCGLSESTAARWLRNPEFQSRYQQAKDQVLRTATALLRRYSAGAATILFEIANDGKARDAARVSAAKGIIEMALQAHETESLEERLRKLEIAMKGDL